jgi:hypothetical protein
MPEVQKEEEEEEDLFVFNENKCGLVSYLVWGPRGDWGAWCIQEEEEERRRIIRIPKYANSDAQGPSAG